MAEISIASMSYWYVHWKENDQGAVAVHSGDSNFTVTDGILTDYLANYLGVRLCSESMRNAIEYLAPGVCEWKEATVTDAGKANRYFVLVSCESMKNYLSPQTIRTDLCIIKAVLGRQTYPTAPILQVEDEGTIWAVHANVAETNIWRALTGVELSSVAEH